ncbi:hypothetical protein PCANC_13122 [Puccinia coronata f. sp. avenae]|uniref:Integrase catalytic domain-containing protein n=1 Tax=Puccinia coronata f. sp. avenae TaxID=200324 RepID=A0A2N5UWC2_9BASI|nr:hypothetical protein PCANC_13122 [Puccinia coronata f. sp. avenae]
MLDKPGRVVAIDLVGPFPESVDGFCYGLVIIDLFSRMTSTYGLKTKADAADQVISWIENFKKHTSHDVYCIRSDNAGELTSNKFNKFLRDKKIMHELSIPYEHHQNGAVERTNRLLLDMARTFIIHARLPATLWCLALKQATFVFNRVVHDGANKTPYELCLGTKPSLHMVKLFGCRAFLHNINYLKQFVPRSRPLVHVGVSEVANGWVLWDPITNKLERGALVEFDESCLPCEGSDHANMNHVLSSIQARTLGDFTQIREMEIQDACIASTVSVAPFMSDAPETYQQALNSSDRTEWLQACDAEIQMMLSLHVWDEVPRTNGQEILNCCWVFALKRNQEGQITNCCARFQWEVASFDVKSAFLHSDIDHNVYIRPPPGVAVSPGCVLKLRKALYGTRQASRCWWLHLKSKLATIGFVPNPEDQSTYVYVDKNDFAFLWVHVDDGLFTASSPTLMLQLKKSLNSVLDLKWDESLSSIVGLRVKKDANGFLIDQPMLVDKIINLNPSAIKTRTLLPSSDLESNPSKEMDRKYLSRIGCLLYLAQGSRPDISFAVNYLARFSMAPDKSHWSALDHLIAYVCFTASTALPIRATGDANDCIRTFVDANWGGEGSRSVHGLISTVWGAPISWGSKRQTCAARSSCQAEYMALSFGSKDCCYLKSLLSQFIPVTPPLIFSDSKAAVHISKDCGTRKAH